VTQKDRLQLRELIRVIFGGLRLSPIRQIVATDIPIGDEDNVCANDVSDKDVCRKTPRRDAGRFPMRSFSLWLDVEEGHMRHTVLGKSARRPINLC
jgi:hypothetical protein